MIRAISSVIAVLVLAGCGNGYAPPAPPAAPTAPVEPDDAMTMSGVDLYHHDPRPTGGVARKPTFWLHANTFSMLGETTWSVENARAVIYEADTGAEQMVLEARRGQFEQDKSATLNDDVTVRAGAMVMKMSNIVWHNRGQDTPSEIVSESPLTLDDPAVQLQASSLHLYPDTHEFELTDVTGVVHFRRNQS
jgi:hypothetical protein